jgi:hypothetical protein
MNILLTIVLIVSLSIDIYSNTFLKTSLNKITNIYKKIKMNENPIFQIEEDTIVMHIYGKNNNSVKNHTINRYSNKHAGYDFAMLII